MEKENIVSLKGGTGLSLTIIRGKLEVLQKHYQLLNKLSMDSMFDAKWKDEVEDSARGSCGYPFGQKIEKSEIAK